MADDRLPALDNDGFLVSHRAWDEAAAHELARRVGIELTEAHWRVLHAARAFYRRYERSPDMRPLVKWVRETVDPELGTSIALLRLFPDQPARHVSRIAGLPKPANCL